MVDVTETQVKDYITLNNYGVNFFLEGGYIEQLRRKKLEILQIKSVIRTNESVRRTNNLQKWLIGLATVFSAASLFISYLNYRKEQPINLPAPRVIIQQQPILSAQDTSSRNTLRNQPPFQK